MRNFKINNKKLAFFLFTCCLILNPLVFIDLRKAQDQDVSKTAIINNNEIMSLLGDRPLPNNQEENDGTYQDLSKFDSDLTNIILNQTMLKAYANKEIKIILMFKDGLRKEQRTSLIAGIFENYEIIAKYDIIPGVYLKCNFNDLINNEEVLTKTTEITGIFLSDRYTYPLNEEGSLHSSNLNKNSYPNWWIPDIYAENLPYNGTGVRVGVIDTGIYDHPDLNLILSQNFVSGESPTNNIDTYGHGTHVAGIIGSSGASSGGIYRGVAPGVSLISARAGNYSGLEEGDIINAMDWLVKPESSGGAEADIVSMSFGGGLPDANDPMTLALSNAAINYGVILVASAGNSGPGYLTGGSPASGTYVISVGATTSSDTLASFSSWGPSLSYLGYPDVAAPGVNIISTNSPGSVLSDEKQYIGDYFDFGPDVGYIPLSGTSMACPVVSGTLAVLKSAYPSLSPEAARIALLNGARKSVNDNFEYLRYGAGIVNASASLEYLNKINQTLGDVNDVAKIFPEKLPIEPFDLLNFPGDHQAFNLTFLSGTSGTSFDIDIPASIEGLTLHLDKQHLTFTNGGVNFSTLDVKVNDDAVPGIVSFQLNLTSSMVVYDIINFSIEIRFPEYHILMESYHGLNDWFPEISFNEMGYYKALKDLSKLNISFDIVSEYWTPYYNKSTDNSILTSERLSQYDLIVLQDPILPYSQLEIQNIYQYYNSGGNLLFFGTRHQDLCIENINALFDALGVQIHVNEETLLNENWIGVGASVIDQDVDHFSVSPIFDSINRFIWSYGNSFSISGSAQSLATLNERTVVASYDGRSLSKGRVVAFGDFHWLYDEYDKAGYYQNHHQLLENLLNYLLYNEQYTLDIHLDSERISSPSLNLSIFVKDQALESPVSSSLLNANLNVSIHNGTYYEEISTVSMNDGIATNFTYNLPFTSANPYTITANLSIGGIDYIKEVQVLYYNAAQVPTIISFTISDPVSRSGSSSLDVQAHLDSSSYEVKALMAIYSYSYYNTKNTVNRTLTLTYAGFNYTASYDPSLTDPSGYVLVYMIPRDPISSYINPYSPRIISQIKNFIPEIDEYKSTFTIQNSNTYRFDETHDNETSYAVSVTQGNNIFFNITTVDGSPLEDTNSSRMRVSVNLFTVSTTSDNYIMFIFPNVFPVTEFSYIASSNTHQGTFSIPFTMSYSTIHGSESVSTESTYDFNTNKGYLSVLLITVFDSDGGSNDFIIILTIQPGTPLDLLILIIIIGIISLIALFVMIGVLVRRSRRKRGLIYPYQEIVEESRGQDDQTITPSSSFYCPYCGYLLTGLRNFCPNCGKSLKFTE